MITLDELRRFAVARNFFTPTALKRALQKMGFVQADPIRAPARAQDLILRHRVKNYHAGDIERRYEELDIEEDFFVNYGYVTRSLQRLMHPRSDARMPADDIGQPWPDVRRKQAQLLLEFVREHSAVHPREVDEHFSHGKVKNYWGGSSNATTHLLEAMQYNGMLRVARREKGIRIYTTHQHEGGATNPSERRARIDALLDAVVRIYAPLPSPSLSFYVRRLRYAVPQWREELSEALQRARQRLSHGNVNGVEWYWPSGENLLNASEATGRQSYLGSEDAVRLLAPFDPLVHDRSRFELLWGWVYRFEAYTPAVKRKLGYYAMPLLWRDRVIGWGNLSIRNGSFESEFGYVASRPTERAFKRELDDEVDRMRAFLNERGNAKFDVR